MENGKKRILVVDDDKFVRGGLMEVLTIRGYDVDTAEDGYEALKQVEEGEFDLILLDLILPGISGVETLTRILRSKPLSNVIAMTAYSEQAVVAKAMAEGAKRCFLKPMDLDLLEDALKEVASA
ncbi:MAG: response regulator [bacterium]